VFFLVPAKSGIVVGVLEDANSDRVRGALGVSREGEKKGEN
jgi:hypothetical protein